HGDAQSSAPPTGAHRAHLVAGTVRGPIACSECHQVPATVSAPGHIDHAGPAALVFGALATARGATPAWDRTSGTCTNVYCHGAVNPGWTASADSTIYCGACHGLPPSDAAHAPTLKVTDCATCHPSTVGPFGNILVGNGRHIN